MGLESLLLRMPRRTEQAVLDAAAAAARRGAAETMEFCVLAGAAQGPGTLLEVQTLADELVCAEGRGPMCFPNSQPPSVLQSAAFLRVEEAEAGGCTLQHTRAHAGSADVLLPLASLAALNAVFALFHWWLAVLLLPVLLSALRPIMVVWARTNRVGLVSPVKDDPPSRTSAVAVAGQIVAGLAIFAGVLAPELRYSHPWLCGLEAAMFIASPYFFYQTVVTDAGCVPRGGAGQAKEGARLCPTCTCVRPLRSKHDPAIGRCVRKFDHYCPLVWNAVGEDNQAYFVLFCATMLAGQAAFVLLALDFLALHGEGVFHVLRRAPARGFALHPVVALNAALTACAAAFDTLLVVRAAYGVAAELTSNEQANWPRYPYLQAPGERDETFTFRNPFDAGVVANTRRFFAALRPGGAPGGVDWDALLHEAAPPPFFSIARFEAVLGRCFGQSGRRVTAHGHSHGGVACKGHHEGRGGGQAPSGAGEEDTARSVHAHPSDVA